MRRCGKRASGSAAAWQASPAGHPLQHMIPRYVPDAPPPRKSCITSPSPSSPTKTQRMALLPCLRGSSGAGLRLVHTEASYVEEGDLLEMPAKRRHSPRPGSPNGPPQSATQPHPTYQAKPRPSIDDIPVCTGRNYRNFFSSKFSDPRFRSPLNLHAVQYSILPENSPLRR